MFPENIREILHKVLVSQMCLSDEIHDARKCGEDITYRNKKYDFWGKAEKILRNAITEIEKELEILGDDPAND